MALFDEKSYGTYISERMGVLITAYTNLKERNEIAVRHDICSATLRNVISRQGRLSYKNAPAMLEVVKLAFSKAKGTRAEAKEAEAELEILMNS
ncbi:hypothetical protein ElyMa_002318700 [Elysia marginata]|uniref:HTH psq-type domain-containing protein n=1 Tax=Elysia marginata TaxID=1093978 RepID=A0AAV4G7Q1_9GAST|nr:hypothetical protein ElyMa_002318700 [Elysia marginata]